MRDTAPIRIWIKSSYSGHNNNCMEFLSPPPLGKAVVRDSKDPHRRMIVFRAETWTQFVHTYRSGAPEPTG
ncbi:DUF397 domain-containing protein [Streptomyces alanosinicus]|uniref:DUF397 domain-containing protein n=1 Tax=Streptomyces alanosinicus TaxID=68171 RepID=A0A919D1W7_9ACTN|nr:DUF397 domain-containing protein [Streptomyces alanosinicus]GHE02959.1 hypothetical protein GCM10010339_28340 [Streptomyces alanosinicus]